MGIKKRSLAPQFLLVSLLSIMALSTVLSASPSSAYGLVARDKVVSDQGTINFQAKASEGIYFVPLYMPPDLNRASLVGELSPDNEVTVLLTLRLRNEGALNSFLEGLSDPNSPNFRHFLNPPEFVERFSPSAAEYSDLVSYFSSANMNVITHDNRLALSVKGSAQKFEELLGVEFSLYKNENVSFYSATNPKLPSRFVPLVKGVIGLDNATVIRPFHYASPFAAGGRPPFTPQQIGSAYGISSLHNRGINGKGQNVTIVVAYGSQTLANDLKAFDNQFSAARAGGFSYHPLGQPPTQNKGWAEETTLDFVWTGVTAPGATINLVIAPTNRGDDLFGAVNFAISRNLGKIISLSWGLDGGEKPQYSLFEPILQQAVAQGIAVFVATGDCGAYVPKLKPDQTWECDKSNRAVSYPASSPYVTAVGGTSLFLDSQDRYVRETGWNGSGGGVSTLFSMPSWQKRGGVPESANRILPDIAMLGDWNTGVWLYVDGKWLMYGGTSLASPLMAASYALANQLKGTNLGFASPLIYNQVSSSGYGTVIRDVVTGSNGFQSGTGWDYVTGWGTPDVNLLATSFADRLRRVAVSSLPGGLTTTISVDRDIYRTPATLWIDSGTTHQFTVNQTLSVDSGTRYLFTGWNGVVVGQAPTLNARVTQDGSLTLNYKKQYLLTVSGGSQPSSDWLDVDSEAKATTSYIWNEEAGKSRLVLVSWQLGNANPQPITRQTSGTFTIPPIIMNAPQVLTFRSVTQFFVNASTPFGEVTGKGWYDSGTGATIGLQPGEVGFGNQTRVLFKRWTGSVTTETPTTTITVNEPKRISAEWALQYLLSVRSDYGVKQNESWVDQGARTTVILNPLVDQGNLTRRALAGWSGDMQSSSQRLEVLMDKPKTIKAEWKTQYFVVVKSIYGKPAGQGWFDKGLRDIISVEPTVDLGNGTQRVFKAWKGGEGKPPLFDVEVIRPLNFEADWKTQFLLRVDTDFPQATSSGGWFDEDSIATVSVSSPILERRNGTMHVFAGKETSLTIRMDSPKIAAINWKTQYLVTINSRYGQAIGDGWHDSGSTAQIGLSPTAVGVLVQQAFDGWTGDLDSSNPDSRVLVDSPKVITAKWRTDYTQLIVVLAVAGAVGVFVIRRRGLRKIG
ncbi:MAG: S8/S53 family peptidase [Thaumarchaeota archaeon]|nr:S8/S53 family peptidase [Nitrososphaerota archaeon]